MLIAADVEAALVECDLKIDTSIPLDYIRFLIHLEIVLYRCDGFMRLHTSDTQISCMTFVSFQSSHRTNI